MECAFCQNFADTLEQEHAQAALKQGFQMKGEDMDDYVAKFEHLAQHARYNLDNIKTLDLFTAGLLSRHVQFSFLFFYLSCVLLQSVI